MKSFVNYMLTFNDVIELLNIRVPYLIADV
jgi:hypothetical protein